MGKDIRKMTRLWCHKVIPLIYDDSLSYYEILCKVRFKINEIIDRLNTLEDLSENVKDEVEEILNEWLEDGTLADIIDEALKYREQNITMIYPEYVSTFSYPCGVYEQESSYDVVQSFCFITNTDCVAVRSKRYPGDNENDGKVFKFSVTDGLATTYDYTYDIGHANDICFDGQYVYIAFMTEHTTETIDSNKVCVLDTNLNFIKYINVPGITKIVGMDYNDSEKLFYLYNNDTIYIYEDLESSPTSYFQLNFSYYRNYYNLSGRFSVNTISCLKNTLLINTAYPSISFEFDYDGNIVTIRNYAEYYNNGFNTLELEKVAFNKYDGYFYMFSYAVQGIGDYGNNTLGKYSLKKGQVYDIAISATTRPNYYTTSQRIYVNNDIDGNAKMLGTYQYPFKYLQQAVDCYKRSEQGETIVVLNVASVQDLGTVTLTNMSNVRITTYPDEAHGETNTLIPELRLVYCSNILINYMNIGNVYFADCGSVQLGTCRILDGTINKTAPLIVLYNNYIRLDSMYVCGVIGRTHTSNDIVVTEYTGSYDLGTEIT